MNNDRGELINERDRAAMRAVLEANVGFHDVERWVDFALRSNFQRVEATPRLICPDCGATSSRQLGQYVYYSTLIRLRRCAACSLIWSDALLPPQVVQAHFESTYKDRDYFKHRRRLVFDDLIDRVSRLQRSGGSVLDVGGAQGDLMSALQRRRPDLHCVVHDVSRSATEHASAVFGLDTLNGDIASLAESGRQFNVIVLSDVLYYEPRIDLAWSALAQLLASDGALLIRVPNKLALIRAAGLAMRLLQSQRSLELQRSVPFFNPEHLYVLDRRYLARRLHSIGCDEVRFAASPPLLPDGSQVALELAKASGGLSRTLSTLTGGRVILSPGVVVEARRTRRSQAR